ncbi:hypothetical protein Tco_0892781 [Tanacetum coccineum]|uniref:Uncharacterized protein n=1 Tax=Tanacetum coccineum TaxID=301880 RepID=A0ABQ5CCA1_9ASTR
MEKPLESLLHKILQDDECNDQKTFDSLLLCKSHVQFLQQLQPDMVKDFDPKQVQRDKDMQKNLALIAKYFKKIYKPTNNNLRTSSNTRIKNVDTNPRYKNDNLTGQFRNQRVVLLLGIEETVVKAKNRLKTPTYHKEKYVALFTWQRSRRFLMQTPCNDSEPLEKTEFERYKAFNDRTVDYDKLERKLNETLGLLAQKEIDIKEGLKLKAYEISVVKEKHDELVKQSLLTKSHYEGLVNEKTKIPYDQSDPANRLVPNREETLTLEKESRSKLNKDLTFGDTSVLLKGVVGDHGCFLELKSSDPPFSCQTAFRVVQRWKQGVAVCKSFDHPRAYYGCVLYWWSFAESLSIIAWDRFWSLLFGLVLLVGIDDDNYKRSYGYAKLGEYTLILNQSC